MRKTIGLIAIAALVGLGACGDSTGPDTSSAFAAPRQLQPADGTVFNNFPRDTTLVWASVAGAASYWVQVEYCQPPQCIEGSTARWHLENVTTTSYSFSFVGAQPGRWRVWAVSANGLESEKSPWWIFYYTR